MRGEGDVLKMRGECSLYYRREEKVGWIKNEGRR